MGRYIGLPLTYPKQASSDLIELQFRFLVLFSLLFLEAVVDLWCSNAGFVVGQKKERKDRKEEISKQLTIEWLFETAI